MLSPTPEVWVISVSDDRNSSVPFGTPKWLQMLVGDIRPLYAAIEVAIGVDEASEQCTVCLACTLTECPISKLIKEAPCHKRPQPYPGVERRKDMTGAAS